ncbi:HAMP domain-containing sensor histidine kinase [Formosa sp. PL04]|uniref:sensor histidine kinase n=1 Tax=Formosa sp. PL04 TaxID=3081755 RepID=UPI00298274C5|nr:HAMP domain-containing sensor histidine kinase [Formosa sp. PL04]MDW5288496.1 HAMP domain-containing sensor histidine kinase [Formosa sp. PL04]
MNSTERALKERIKELTCLYEVSSIIVNADYEQVEDMFSAISYCLKKAFQHPKHTEICIQNNSLTVKTGEIDKNSPSIYSPIKLFNVENGFIKASYSSEKLIKNSFLDEEQMLLNNVALKLGSLLERFQIIKNEASLKRQMERNDRLNILGEITAGIAHELNTPLANILGFAELLQSKITNAEELNDLDKILNSAIYSREVVKKLMFFACEMPQQMTIVNIVPLIKNAVSLLEPSFKKQQVKYIVKIDSEVLNLKADTIQLTQIIFNLIINAIYFSKPDDLVTIEALENANDICLKISDQGQGVSNHVLDKIFQPFFTTKPVGEGSGLGLSVVHGIVTSHKGTIIVENNQPKGAIFIVKLPKY